MRRVCWDAAPSETSYAWGTAQSAARFPIPLSASSIGGWARAALSPLPVGGIVLFPCGLPCGGTRKMH
jgi:hypothetical protein